MMTCKDCRFFRETEFGITFCTLEIACELPFWAKRTLEGESGNVKPEDGEDCDTWEQKR